MGKKIDENSELLGDQLLIDKKLKSHSTLKMPYLSREKENEYRDKIAKEECGRLLTEEASTSWKKTAPLRVMISSHWERRRRDLNGRTRLVKYNTQRHSLDRALRPVGGGVRLVPVKQPGIYCKGGRKSRDR